jgi:hypothetical protein
VLGAVVLDRLVVEQGVDGPAALLVVGLVHATPELGPPLGHRDGSGCRRKKGPMLRFM